MSWLLVVSMLVAPGAAGAQDVALLKKLVVNLPFEEVELIVMSEAQRQNLNLVNVLDIAKGMENRGQPFRPYRIYQFCNLELGIRIFADAPDYGAFQLCGILIYELQAGQTALVSARQTWTLRNLPDHQPGPTALAAAREVERAVDEIFNAVVEENKAGTR